ncbi:MAG: nuclear transport factor 2 family protein, partial [Planctomycetaceae bacterium]|nr:nuclear transport factor 2 family protein [Planctomycetaceae bacterium]
MNDTNTETGSGDDAVLLEQIRGAMKKVHEGVGMAFRGQHPKGLGVVHGAFQVHEVPIAYRVGVFAEPKSYATWIRFSIAKEWDDRSPNVRGMAIKLLGVPGEKLAPGEAEATTHDFVLATHPVFFARDAKHFLQFLVMKGAQAKEAGEAKIQGKSPEELAALEMQHLKQLVAAFPVTAKFFTTAESPLTQQYFSQTPYQYGNYVVKYFVQHPDSKDRLVNEMQQRLATSPQAVQFEFGIEVQTNPETMPIDDATQPWNSPERVILGTITIPPQDFQSDERKKFGENLSFSPWHALPEHRPLGSLNEARRAPYIDSSTERHKTSQTVREEPELSDFNALTLGRYFEFFKRGDYVGMQSCLHPDVEFSDTGFDLRGKEVGAMWHMIISKGIQVSKGESTCANGECTIHWECDYVFRKDAKSTPRPVHNVVTSKFKFEGGLIRSQHDECDFWRWFEQAMGPIGKGLHLLDIVEDAFEWLVGHDVPPDIEKKARAAVKETGRTK